MRKILHLDVNSYYATLEQQAYPNLRGKPIGIAGKGRGERTVIVGVSIEAKKMGLRGIFSTWEAKRILPELIVIPANYDRYSSTSKRIFTIMGRYSPTVEIFSIDEAFADLGEQISWDEAAAIAQQIKEEIYRKIGRWVTCSIGISYGRTLAKLASEIEKPNGLTIVRPEDFARVAAATPIEELSGIGWRLRPRLNQLGIFTIAELGRAAPESLKKMFGEYTGTWLHQIGNGIDRRTINAYQELPQEKSVGHSYTVPRDLTSLEDARKILLLLSERVGRRLRKKNLFGRCVSVYLRFEEYGGWGERFTGREFIQDGYQIYQAAEKLVERLTTVRPIRLVAVTISDLQARSVVTAPLFPEQRQSEGLLRAMDKLNSRYGEGMIYRATLAKIKERIFSLPDGRHSRIYVPDSNPFVKRFD